MYLVLSPVSVRRELPRGNQPSGCVPGALEASPLTSLTWLNSIILLGQRARETLGKASSPEVSECTHLVMPEARVELFSLVFDFSNTCLDA